MTKGKDAKERNATTSKERREYDKLTAHLYTTIKWSDECAYCHGKAVIWNRVISSSVATMLMRLGKHRLYNGAFKIVPSCRGCASAAQELLFTSLLEKAHYIMHTRTKPNSEVIHNVELRTAAMKNEKPDQEGHS